MSNTPVTSTTPPVVDTPYELWQRQPVNTIGPVTWGPYQQVYTGHIGVDPRNSHVALESLFRTFNIDHPADFTGHSLSVCDRVVLGETTFEVASFGFDLAEHPSTAPETVDQYFF